MYLPLSFISFKNSSETSILNFNIFMTINIKNIKTKFICNDSFSCSVILPKSYSQTTLSIFQCFISSRISYPDSNPRQLRFTFVLFISLWLLSFLVDASLWWAMDGVCFFFFFHMFFSVEPQKLYLMSAGVFFLC